MATSKSLRESILTVVDIQEQEVEIPEWKVTVLLRGLTGEQKAMLNESLMPSPTTKKIDYKKLYGELIVMGVLDPATRKPVFEAADLQPILQKNAGVVERLALAVMSISGLSPGSMTDAIKN